jgi:thiamine pyrophosphate-dependent acetolactate synthase large subunit-like protein
MDYQALPPVDLFISADPDTATAALVQAIGPGARTAPPGPARPLHEPKPGRALGIEDLAHALRGAVGKRDVSLAHLPLSWQTSFWHFRHPLDFLGSDGGGGVGGGPGISVGAALALKGSGRLPIGICGDGDFLMSVTSLWTAVHYRIPLLIIVANNRSFYNDEVHQERMAILRNRPVDNKWIGQKMLDPEIDMAALARAQGARGYGPISKAEELPAVFAEAIAAVDAGEVAVVDVRIEPGYGARDAGGAMARKSG